MTTAVEVAAAALGLAAAWSTLLAAIYTRRHTRRVVAARTAGTLTYADADLQLLANVRASTTALHLGIVALLLALSTGLPALVRLL